MDLVNPIECMYLANNKIIKVKQKNVSFNIFLFFLKKIKNKSEFKNFYLVIKLLVDYKVTVKMR